MSRLIAVLLAAAVSTIAVAQPYAVERLEKSPRHSEWQSIDAGDGRTLHAFVAWPERKADATTVIVIHENRGLTDWVRSFSDQLAEAGYVAIAPDLLSGFDADHARTSDFESEDAARTAIGQLDGARVTRDLRTVFAHAVTLPGSNGRIAVAGFCWGGAQSFRLATDIDDLAAAFVFYGTAPTDEAALGRIRASVYGFYGADDQRINATIDATGVAMARLGKKYEPVIYDGAGHAFMRAGDDPAAAEPVRTARNAAFNRLTELLGKLD